MAPGTESPPVPVRRVLVVDDSLSIQQAVREALAASPGIQVLACGDVESAEAILATEKPDLVLCDVVLPGRPGYDLCRQITLGKGAHRPPVFLLSGIFEPFDEEKARAAGADAVITKPFRPEQIQQLLEKALAPPAALAGPAASLPDAEAAEITAADVLTPQPAERLVRPPADPVGPPPTTPADRHESGLDELVRRLVEPLSQCLVEPVAKRVLHLLAGQEKPLGDLLGETVRATAEMVVRQRLRELESETEKGTGHGGSTPSPD